MPLQTLIASLAMYRSSVDGLVIALRAEENSLQTEFLNVAMQTSALYANALQVRASLPLLYQTSNEVEIENCESNVEREMQHRRMLQTLLETSKAMLHFDTAPAMFPELDSLTAYINALSLHLPEMYEETFQTEFLTNSLLQENSSLTLTVFEISLQHLCRNHLLFVQPALEELSDSSNWNTPVASLIVCD